MIEEKIDQLIAALNANTAALAGVPTPKKEKVKAETPAAVPDKPKPEVPSGPTMNDVRGLAQKLVDGGRIADVKDANKAVGIAKVSECPPDKIAELHEKLKNAVDALSAV